MDTSVIKDLIFNLNNKWFEDKKSFFELEMMIWLNKNEEMEDLGDYSFINYCWHSVIENYIPNNEEKYKPEHLKLAVDAEDIAHKIVSLIDKEIQKKSHISIKYNIISTSIVSIKSIVRNLIDTSTNDQHKVVLGNFLINIENIINKKFSEIKVEADELSQLIQDDRKLTIEMCTKIANFKLGKRKLVTHVRMKKTKVKLTEKDGLTEGEALFEIFNPEDTDLPQTDVFMESWNTSDIYLLLNELESFFYGVFSLKIVDEKFSLLYEESDYFVLANFRSWHSQKKETYLKRYPKKLSEIQELVSSLSRR